MFKRLLESRALGAMPLFTEYHLHKALKIVEEGPIGRGLLARRLGVGEGSARTIVKILKSGGLIRISRRGCEIKKEGLNLLKELRRHIVKTSKIEAWEFAIGKYAFATLVGNAGNKVKRGVEQRDAAIKAGASGATTIIFRHGKLLAPTISEDLEKDYPELAKVLFSTFEPNNNDVIVIGTANEETAAERGAEVAAGTLLRD